MRKLILLSAALFMIAACIKSDPSWKIEWENPADEHKEQPQPQPQQEDPDVPDIPDIPDPPEIDLAGSFVQDFGAAEPEHFKFRTHSEREDFRYFSAFPSLSESSTDILLLRLDPADASGVGNGPGIRYDTRSLFGTYSIRVKMPDLSRFRSKTDARFDFGVCGDEGDNTAIKISWKLSDPSTLTLSLQAGTAAAPQNTTLEVRPSEALAKDFNASSLFHTYGFDWTEEGVQWWIMNPSTKSRTVIGKTEAPSAVPVVPAFIGAEAHHGSAAPKYPFEIEIDCISFTEL